MIHQIKVEWNLMFQDNENYFKLPISIIVARGPF